jgi:hypothetical protein
MIPVAGEAIVSTQIWINKRDSEHPSALGPAMLWTGLLFTLLFGYNRRLFQISSHMGAFNSDDRDPRNDPETHLADIAKYERMDDRSAPNTRAVDHGDSVCMARKGE